MPTMAERKAALGLEGKMDAETHGGGGGVKGRVSSNIDQTGL